VDGLISGNGNVLITNGLSQSGSDLVAGNNLIADGLISQTANSSIVAGNGITFNADIAQNASSIGAQNITLSGNLTQQNGSTVDATTGFTAVNLSNITQSGGSTLAGGTGGITIGGTLTQNDSTLSATGAINLATSNPAAVPSVEVTQTNGGTIISTGGNIYVLGGFNQTDSSLTAAGNISLVATALTQNNSVIATSGGSLTLAGAGTGGAVSQSNGSTLYGANGISLALQGSLSQDASSEIYASSGNIAITAGGGISFTGLIQAGTQTTSGAYSGNLLLVAAGGSVDAANGTLLAGGLTVAAGGDIDISSPADTYGAIIQSGGFAGITAGGNVNFAQTAALALSDATISAGGAVTITDASGITVSNSRITAGGNVSLAANTGNLTEDSASTIASHAGTISLNAPGTVTLAGTISAPKITVGDFGTGNATGPASVVLNGGTIATGTAVAEGNVAQNVAQAQNSDGAAGGLFITAGSITQTGSTVINGLGGNASVQLALTGPGGGITLDGTQGLQAPGAQLLIDLQSTGNITGNINVGGLNIFYGADGPAAGSYARLTGQVDNDSGFAAAGAGFVHPQQYAADQINGCTIGSVNCVLLTPVTTVVPLFLPVFEIDITPARKRDDDDDLILPNVGEQDY
jgi:filamentous hemagglutinin